MEGVEDRREVRGGRGDKAHQVADARVNAKGKESGSLVRGMNTMGVSAGGGGI